MHGKSYGKGITNNPGGDNSLEHVTDEVNADWYDQCVLEGPRMVQEQRSRARVFEPTPG